MDDTVILATSRQQLEYKLSLLNDYCESHEMVINIGKTKLMVINGDQHDRREVNIGELCISHCDEYVYLGAIFTADGSTLSSLKRHFTVKQAQLNKLIIFLNVNKDMPFIAKWKVVNAAFNASILYGCEAWLDVSCHIMNSLYIGAIKMLLGVRPTCTNDVCLIELGLPPLQALIKHKQQQFFSKALGVRQYMDDDPLMFALRLTRNSNHRMSAYIDTVLDNDNHIESAINALKESIYRIQTTRYQTYVTINPLLEVHNVYNSKHIIPEHYRTYFTRMRLSSHRL